MKTAIERLIQRDRVDNGAHLKTTVLMILVFLAFWGVSFYVLVNSLA